MEFNYQIPFVLLLVSSIFTCLVSSVRYYEYAVPIPRTSSSTGIASKVNRALVSSSSAAGTRSRAVQFLVNDKKTKGKYHFGYDTGEGDMGGSYREEVREPNGTIKGFYGYVDPQGTLRITEYVADSAGFRSNERKIELHNSGSNDIDLQAQEEMVERLQLIGPIPKPLAQLFKTTNKASSSQFSKSYQSPRY